VSKPEAVITVQKLLMMSDNIARNMLSIGIINCSTQLHLVAHFYKNYDNVCLQEKKETLRPGDDTPPTPTPTPTPFPFTIELTAIV
jgi:multisubunit Na+/H+ antiporter MnhC subunit